MSGWQFAAEGLIPVMFSADLCPELHARRRLEVQVAVRLAASLFLRPMRELAQLEPFPACNLAYHLRLHLSCVYAISHVVKVIARLRCLLLIHRPTRPLTTSNFSTALRTVDLHSVTYSPPIKLHCKWTFNGGGCTFDQPGDIIQIGR